MKINNHGFSPLIIVTIIAIVGCIGLIGYNLGMSHNSKSQPEDTKQITTQSVSAPKAAGKKADEQPALTIKEWGVKIPLSVDTKNAYYTVGPAADQRNITVFSKDVDAITGPAGISCKGEYIAYLLRLPVNDAAWNDAVDSEMSATALYQHRTVIGQYRYAIATKKQYGPECFQKTAGESYEPDQATVN